MPLSGIFFVSLYHQSNRKNMFKKTDPNPLLDMFTAPLNAVRKPCFKEVF